MTKINCHPERACPENSVVEGWRLYMSTQQKQHLPDFSGDGGGNP